MQQMATASVAAAAAAVAAAAQTDDLQTVEKRFTQRLDHFNATDERNFTQVTENFLRLQLLYALKTSRFSATSRIGDTIEVARAARAGRFSSLSAVKRRFSARRLATLAASPRYSPPISAAQCSR